MKGSKSADIGFKRKRRFHLDGLAAVVPPRMVPNVTRMEYIFTCYLWQIKQVSMLVLA